jgi:hypothetical protein
LLLQDKCRNFYRILFVFIFSMMVVAMPGWSNLAAASSLPFRITAATRIPISPTTLDFGPVTVGVQKTANVTVSNNRRSKVTISQISATGAGFNSTRVLVAESL